MVVTRAAFRTYTKWIIVFLFWVKRGIFQPRYFYRTCTFIDHRSSTTSHIQRCIILKPGEVDYRTRTYISTWIFIGDFGCNRSHTSCSMIADKYYNEDPTRSRWRFQRAGGMSDLGMRSLDNLKQPSPKATLGEHTFLTNDVTESNPWYNSVLVAIFQILAIVLTVLRLVVRFRKRRLWWEDLLAGVAAVGVFIALVTSWVRIDSPPSKSWQYPRHRATNTKNAISVGTRLNRLETGRHVLVCVPWVHMCAVGGSDEHHVLHHTYYTTYASITCRIQMVVHFIRSLLVKSHGPEALHLYHYSGDLASFPCNWMSSGQVSCYSRIV